MSTSKNLRVLAAGVILAIALAGQALAEANSPDQDWLWMGPSLVSDQINASGEGGNGGSGSNPGNGSGAGENGGPGIDGETPPTRITGTIVIVKLGPDENALGASSSPGSSATIDQDGVCSWVDNAGTPATAFMPLRTLLERTSFRMNLPAQISLPNCCRQARARLCGVTVDLPYGRDGEVVQLAGGHNGQGHVMCEAATFSWKPAGAAGLCTESTDEEGHQCDSGCSMDFASVSVEGREE